MFKRMFTENEIKELAETVIPAPTPTPEPGDSTVLVEIDMAGGTLAADVLEALIEKPYNAVIAVGGESTAYMTPVLVSPHYNGETITSFDIYVIGNPNPISLATIAIDASTGVYTVTM